MSRATPCDGLLLFTPVANAYRGRNGWTAEVQRAFIAALARSGVVGAVGRPLAALGLSAACPRRRGQSDRARLGHALARGGDRAIDVALDGADTPRRVEIWHRGRFVGWRTFYDNRLARAALDQREERWMNAGLDATKLLADATEVPKQREK